MVSDMRFPDKLGDFDQVHRWLVIGFLGRLFRHANRDLCRHLDPVRPQQVRSTTDTSYQDPAKQWIRKVSMGGS